MPTPRVYYAVGVVNGVVYAVGGSTASGCTDSMEAYDPSTNAWTERAPMPTAVCSLAVGVIDGILYAVGGGNNGLNADPAVTEAYDPVTNTWTAKAPMPTPRNLLSVGVINGILWRRRRATQAVHRSAPQTMAGRSKPTIRQPTRGRQRRTCSASTRSSPPSPWWAAFLYAAAGGFCSCNSPSKALSIVEAYDPVMVMWTTKAPMLTATGGAGVGVVNGILYSVAGSNTEAPTFQNLVEGYDATSDTWTMMTSLPTTRLSGQAAIVNGILYDVGGTLVSGALDPTVYAFTPPLTATAGPDQVVTSNIDG